MAQEADQVPRLNLPNGKNPVIESVVIAVSPFSAALRILIPPLLMPRSPTQVRISA